MLQLRCCMDVIGGGWRVCLLVYANCESPMGSNIESVPLSGCFPDLEHQDSLFCFCGDVPLLIVMSFTL